MENGDPTQDSGFTQWLARNKLDPYESALQAEGCDSALVDSCVHVVYVSQLRLAVVPHVNV
jgi:hypothetical protein